MGLKMGGGTMACGDGQKPGESSDEERGRLKESRDQEGFLGPES